VTAAPAARLPFRRLEALALGRAGLAVVAVWAFAEAIALPIIPDIIVGLLALVMPCRAVRLFVAMTLGSLAGSAVLWLASAAAPDAVRAMLLALPAIHPPMLADAARAVAAGDPLSIAQFGPGTPLKVYTFAWAIGPGSPIGLAGGIVLNRIARVGPVVLVLAILGSAAPAFLRRFDRLVLAVYAVAYVALYAAYWG
jgi:hypothetical protein